MKIDIKNPPRRFSVGNQVQFDMHDCAAIRLGADEQVTFYTEDNAQYDVSRKNWGFYATPSLNGRAAQFGLRAVLIRNRATGRYFVMLVEEGKQAQFDAYREQEGLDIITWMDTTERLDLLADKMRETS